MSGDKQTTDKHPDHVDGWDGSLETLIHAIGKMRYDRIAMFIALFDKEIQRQASEDRKAGRKKLATRLERAATHLGLAKNELDRAWTICAPYMSGVSSAT
jgi:propanediol dehydratase small subunit